MDKGGWIRIVEAFVAILLIVGVLLVVINQGYVGKKDISEKVYDAEISILRDIENDNQLRTEILNAIVTPEDAINWDEFETFELSNVRQRILLRTPDYLECRGQICDINSVCAMEEYVANDVYAQQVIITATIEDYDPRILKLFCWII